jgi:hypothetical protein
MSVNPSDKGLLTPDNCVVLLIDHQPQMFMGVAISYTPRKTALLSSSITNHK